MKILGDPTGPIKDLNFQNAKPSFSNNIRPVDVLRMAKRYFSYYPPKHQSSIKKAQNYAW